MFGQPVNWTHVRILTRSYARSAIRGGSGVVFLVLLLLTGLGIAGVIIEPLEIVSGTTGMGEARILDAASEVLRPVLKWWIGVDSSSDPHIVYLLHQKPMLLSGILIILMAFVPWLAVLASFNQFAGDISTKGLRYLLLRTERVNILLSRFFGVVLFSGTVTLLMVVAISLYISAKFGVWGFGETLLWGLQGWFALFMLGLPFICLCTWLSASLDSVGGSLVLGVTLAYFPSWILGAGEPFLKTGGVLPRLLPWGWRNDLLHPEMGTVLAAWGVMLGFSLLFFYLGGRKLVTRDL